MDFVCLASHKLYSKSTEVLAEVVISNAHRGQAYDGERKWELDGHIEELESGDFRSGPASGKVACISGAAKWKIVM